MIKIIHWNIGYSANIDLIIKELKTIIKNDCIVSLLEVTPENFEILRKAMPEDIKIKYSLKYRKPGKFDGKNRKLGIAFLTNKNVSIVKTQVLNRTVFPERTLAMIVNIDGKQHKIMSFHSLTGCDYKKAKSTNFLSLAEYVNKQKYDIVTFDANEPNVDHYNIENMQFYNKNGIGAKVLFNELLKSGLEDSYISNFDKNTFIEGKPLAVSHKILSTNEEKRYDFIFFNNKKYKIKKCDYYYENAVSTTADHAYIICNLSTKKSN